MLTPRIALAILATTAALPALGAEFMFAADYHGQRIEGRPLYWTKTQILIQSRDGVLHYLDPKKAENAQRTSPVFEGFSPSEMRASLSEEFGDGFSITSTGHYLVVHRPGESDIWGQRFEELYRAFQNYFRVRNFSLTEPKFPLVAVIYGSEDEYYEQARLSGHNLPPNTLGHYDPLTNRVLMFDRVDVNDSEWGSTANTLVHEATHQTAFNTGLHSRTAVTPKWVVEGLATMFEARGVYQTGTDAQRRDRINRTRLDDYRHFLPSSSGKHELLELIASDQPYNTSAERAYALGWALTFYLNETRPREYEQYLQKIADRPINSEYPAVERVRDFASAFGKDFGLFESNFRTWMTELE